MSEALAASQRLLGLSPALYERTRARLVEALQATFDELVDRGAAMTTQLPGYEHTPLEQVRPNTRRSIQALLHALGTGEFAEFADQFFAVSYLRARQGLPVQALLEVTNITELLLREVTVVTLPDASERLAAFELCRVACDAARRTIFRAFDQAHREARHQLVEAEKMAALGNLVAGVAHELNTPVGVSITAASTLGERTDDVTRSLAGKTLTQSELGRFLEATRTLSDMLLANLQRAADLIQSFKQVAVDRASERQRPIGLRHYLGQVLHSLQPVLRRPYVTVELDIPDDITLDTYPGALAQIVTNLVLNSVVHGFDGRDAGRVALSARREGDRLILRASDDGVGIAPEHLPRIFEPFFTTRRDRGSSGLGLHIVYNLVTQRLGGEIRCDSGPGAGARFTIDLPVAPPGSAS
jgi:signal transduction histidine kinase